MTHLVEEEGADVDGVDRDRVEREGGATDSYCDLNYALLRFTVTASIAQICEKWSDTGKWTEKWCKILMIAEGNMSLS